jgi:hypothetical protein
MKEKSGVKSNTLREVIFDPALHEIHNKIYLILDRSYDYKSMDGSFMRTWSVYTDDTISIVSEMWLMENTTEI